MKWIKIAIMVMAAQFLATACDNLDMDERFDGPIVMEAGKNVLIEDYTGQKCSNCPLAHVEIEKLQELYGRHRIIGVALHGGPQAVEEVNTKVLGLANPQSQEYNRSLGTFSYPKGRIDRQGSLLDVEHWNAAVVARLAGHPQMKLEIDDIVVDTTTRQLTFSCMVGSDVERTGNLQIWLTESNIQAPQMLPAVWGGGTQKDYVHHHVFRAAVNGIAGEVLPLNVQNSIRKSYTFPLEERWNISNMALVVFYYNETEGVIQVIDTPLIQK